jgi:hypothetical protein
VLAQKWRMPVTCPVEPSSRSDGGPPGGGKGFRLAPDAIAALALTLILCLAGMAVLLISTRLGPVVWTDSILYLTGARNWLAGLGLSWTTCEAVKPSTVYAPLFPLMLAGFDIMGVDPIQAGRLINIACYGLNAALIAAFVARGARAPMAGAVAAMLFLVAPGITGMHVGLMTDGPYLTFCLITLFLLATYARCERIWLLLVAGVAASLAYLTRFIGSALVLSGVLFLCLRAKRWRAWLRDGLVFGAVAVVPIAGWYARNYVVSGSASTYRILLRPIDVEAVIAGLRMMADWFLPGFILNRIGQAGLLLLSVGALAVLLLLAVLLALRMRRSGPVPDDTPGHALLALIFLLVYVAAYFASVVAVFPPPTISERYLAPGYATALVLLAMVAVPAWRKAGWALRVALVVVISVLAWNKIAWSRGLLSAIRDDGLAYTSVASRNSETIAAVKKLDPDLIYSNDVTAITFLAGRPACNLPVEFNVSTAEVDFNLEPVETFRARLHGEGAVLVLFNRAPLDSYARVVEGLEQLGTYQDGWIYAASQPAR